MATVNREKATTVKIHISVWGGRGILLLFISGKVLCFLYYKAMAMLHSIIVYFYFCVFNYVSMGDKYSPHILTHLLYNYKAMLNANEITQDFPQATIL